MIINKQNAVITILMVVIIMICCACSGQTTLPGDFEEQGDNPGADDWLYISEQEVLFDFFGTPPDWPREVPAVMNEFAVTRYERSETGMYAAGFGNIQISRANNFYMNARRESGTSFDWTFNPDRTSNIEGHEQVFYYINDRGSSLTINLTQVSEDKIIFELDYRE